MRRTFTALAGLLLGLAACGWQASQETTPSTPTSLTITPDQTPTTPPTPITIPPDKAACTNGIFIGISEGTLFYLGVPPDAVNYTVYGPRIENGVRKATISGGNTTSGIDQTLQVGESVTQPGVGTFTLVGINPWTTTPRPTGLGGSASFCFEPEPGFEIDPCLVKQMFAGETLPPNIPSPAADEPRCPDPTNEP